MRLSGGEDSRISGDDELFELDLSDVEDEDGDEDDEEAEARHLLSEEIRDLEAAVAKKQNEIAASSNPLIRVCSHLRSYTVPNSLNVAETV